MLLVVLSASIYVVLPNNVRIDVENTKTTFKVWENGMWVLAGTERTIIQDGTKIMRAKSRNVYYAIEDNISTITRVANFKENITVIDMYVFDGGTKEVELYPISHTINILNAEGKILNYEVKDLLYIGETIKDIESPQKFGHKMKVEWESGNYYSKIYKYKSRDEGKLTVKYRIDSSDYNKNVRLFDPIVGNDLIIESAETYTLGGNNDTFDVVWVKSGGTLQIDIAYGYLNLTANNITIEGTVNGEVKSNYTGGTAGWGCMSGAGCTCSNGGAGGSGQGSNGGTGGGGGLGCTVYGGGSGGSGASQIGDLDGRYNIASGYAGGGGGGGGGSAEYYSGGGYGGIGGRGGGSIKLSAQTIKISGTINAKGGSGGNGGFGNDYTPTYGSGGGGGGGGSAGTILIDGIFVDLANSIFTVDGGSGGSGGWGHDANYYGSAGSSSYGGRIKIFYSTLDNTSMSTTLGTSGTIYYEQIPYSVANLTSINNLTTENITAYCNGTVVNGRNMTYYWKIYKNDVLNQSGQTGNVSEQINVYNITSIPFIHNDIWKLTCIVSDYIYNTSDSYQIEVHQPIWINITNPTDSQKINEAEVNVTYTFTNYTTYDSCWYTNDSSVTNQSITCGDVIGPYNWTEGSNTITIFSNTTGGGDYSDTITFITIIGNPKVIYGSDTPSNNSWSTNLLNVDLSITDDYGFDNSTYRLYNISGDLINTTIFSTISNARNGPTWNTSIYNGDSNYTFNTTTYNIFGESNSTETRLVKIDSIYPLIEYSANSDTSNSSGNFSTKDWIWINVSVTEVNVENVTFWTWTSTNSIFNKTTVTNQASTYTLNQTNLNRDVYFWNVTVCDVVGKCNTTSERYYGDEEVNLSIEGVFSNQDVELGTNLNISATSTFDWVFIDVDHPSYGTNYSSGKWSTTFNLLINWFRKTLFSDGTSIQENNFTGDIYYMNISSHQYDEVVNLSVNISSTTNATNPVFYKTNTTNIDRAYYGTIVENNVEVYDVWDNSNGTNLYLNATNLTFSDLGDKSIYFYMDDNSEFINLSLNATGVKYGFEYSEGGSLGFTNFDYADKLSSTSLLLGGYILTQGNTPTSFIYDTFNDGSIDSSKWDIGISNGNYYTDPDPDDRYTYTINNGETGGYLRMEVVDFWEDFGNEDSGSGSVNNYIRSNYSTLNSWTPKVIEFELDYYTYAYEHDEKNECTYRNTIKLGNVNVWVSHIDNCEDDRADGYHSCAEYAEVTDNLKFTLTRQEKNIWNVKITGVEYTHGEYQVDASTDCGNFHKYYNYTSGFWNFSTTYPGAGSACLPQSGALQNDFNISNVNWNSLNQFYLNQYVSGWYDGVDNEGCSEIDSWTKVYFVNQTLYNLTNGTFVSESVYDSSGDIASATLEGEEVGVGVTGEDIFYSMSADNGNTWESVTDGVEHTFSTPGRNIKWKADFNLTNPGYKSTTSFIRQMKINTTQSYLSNVTFDFGNDGNIDYTYEGELNETNSPITISLPSASLSNAFTGTADVGDHTYLVPLVIGTATNGQINLEKMNLTYNPNPISLDTSSIQDYLSTYGANETNFSIPIYSSGGNITFEDLRYDYAGGNKTYEITAHNNDSSVSITRNITFYYSLWDYEFIPVNINWIEFIPSSPTAKNVQPYGQNNATGVAMLNITNYGYGGKNTNLSVYLNDTESCVNLTMSISANKSAGSIINNSWYNLTGLSYLGSTDIYMWADYSCSYSTWRLFKPYLFFRQCCEDCSCSEDLT